MADHTSETIAVNGTNIELLRGGAGETMLFLHGAGGASQWAPYMAALARRFDLVVPSHPGYGRSDTPPWLDTIHDLAFFYLDFMEQLDLRDVHLAGNSLGGWLAAEIAIRSTARLKTLTLVSPGGLHVKGVKKGDIFLWSNEQRVRNTFFDQKLAEARLSAEVSQELADIALKNHFTTAKLAWSPRFHDPSLHKWLHRIDVPTMIVWGENDRIFPVALAEPYKAAIPGAELRLIPECGHLPQQEKLDEFLTAVDAIATGAA